MPVLQRSILDCVQTRGAITLGIVGVIKSLQIRFVGTEVLYISILIFMPSVTEIQLNKLRALFPARFAPVIQQPPPHTLSGTQFAQIIGATRAGKSARSLFYTVSL